MAREMKLEGMLTDYQLEAMSMLMNKHPESVALRVLYFDCGCIGVIGIDCDGRTITPYYTVPKGGMDLCSQCLDEAKFKKRRDIGSMFAWRKPVDERTMEAVQEKYFEELDRMGT